MWATTTSSAPMPTSPTKPAGTAQLDRSVNVLNNGNFAGGLSGWTGENYDGSGAAYSVVNGEARVTAAAQGTGSGSYQLHTEGFGLKRNYRYQVSFRARAESPRNIQLRLSENQLNPSAGGTYLLQNIALGTSMANYSFNIDFTAGDNAGRLAFLFGAMGNATTYIDDVVIREVAYIGSGDPLVPAISATNFSGASSDWESEWWGVAQRAVDGSTGNKASGKPGVADNQDLWVSVNIDPDFEVKEILVAGDCAQRRKPVGLFTLGNARARLLS